MMRGRASGAQGFRVSVDGLLEAEGTAARTFERLRAALQRFRRP